MPLPKTKHELSKLRSLEDKGYTFAYKIDKNRLVNLGNNKSYSPQEVKIVDRYRYEGMSNPDDAAILYVIETTDGDKGTIISGYGPSAKEEVIWFLDKVDLNTKAFKTR